MVSNIALPDVCEGNSSCVNVLTVCEDLHLEMIEMGKDFDKIKVGKILG